MRCWLIVIFHLSLCAANCIFDDIKPQRPTQSVVKYVSDKHSRNGRAVDARTSVNNGYKPMRITAKFYDIDNELLPEHETKLRRVVTRAIGKAMELFSVIAVKDSLILSRSSDACQIIIRGSNSSNNGKCGKIHPNYKGETCLDEFTIPDEHLEGLYVYEKKDPGPIEVTPPGEGIPNTDFVLYVKSTSTQECIGAGASIIAYATYCQVDQYDRPLAGYINFCPALIRRQDYDEERIYLTALHELFHALGFSADLFDRFKECRTEENKEDIVCSDSDSGVKDIYNAQRLVAHNLVQLTSRHYNCVTHQTVNEFGPMLQTNSNGQVRSHWDAAFLQGSLMTPTIGLPHLTFLDSITLAFFEDTGWYKVDYTQADIYKWGQYEGCDFGLYPACMKSNRCFCEQPDQTGCHFLLMDKGKCVTDPYLHNCLIFKPDENCETAPTNPDQELLDIHGESYSVGSRCFYSNITTSPVLNEAVSARCYQHCCDERGRVLVKVGTAPWKICPEGQNIQVSGYEGLVKCPETGLLCTDVTEPSAEPSAEPSPTITRTPTKPTTTTSPSGSVDTGSEGQKCMELVFGGADYNLLESKNQISTFRAACLKEIVRVTGCAEKRLDNIYLYDGSVHFQFDILPQGEQDEEDVLSNSKGPSISRVIDILTQTVRRGNFSVMIEGYTYTATDIKFPKCALLQSMRELIAVSSSQSLQKAATSPSFLTLTYIGLLYGRFLYKQIFM